MSNFSINKMRISIIVPIYNRADIVKETLPHILNQPFEDFEVIVVDDGSTDNTLEVLQSIVHPKLKIFTKANAERAAARNFGASKAQGEYLNFFDCDDWMYPNHLTVANEMIVTNNHPPLFHVCYEFKDPQGNVMSKVKTPEEGTAKHLIINNFLACNTVFVKRDIFMQSPFNETRSLSSAEDWELWLRLISRYPIISSNAITFAIQEHDERSLNTISPEKIEARNLELNKSLIQDKPFLKFYKNKVDFFMANSLTFIALSYANTASTKSKAVKYLSKAALTYPPILFSKRYLATTKNIVTKGYFGK
jgi:glycosyltransferase involved in cell wall biosynthesis